MTAATASQLQFHSPTRLGLAAQPAATEHLDRLAGTVKHLASIDPGGLGTEDSVAVARAVEAVVRTAEAALIRYVRNWLDRGDPVRTPETTEEELGWRAADAARKALIVDIGRSRSEAGRLIATANALRRDPPTEQALREGNISAPQARIIAETVARMGHLPEKTVYETRRRLIESTRGPIERP